MALKVIGAGYPRTGTASLKAALEHLSVGRCYHMSELIGRPSDWPLWTRALEGMPIEFDELFGDFAATADAPGCLFYQTLAAKYPAAKIVLTVRESDRWFRSTQETILSADVVRRFAAAPPEFNTMMRKMGWHPEDSATHDREEMIARIDAHNQEVKSSIPRARLLIYEVAQGWGPLCEFLGVPIPDVPFPRVNAAEDFRTMSEAVEGLGAEGVSRSLADQLSRQ
jgi:hypothetical protein